MLDGLQLESSIKHPGSSIPEKRYGLMKVQCPKCHANVPPANVNVAADAVWCAGCNEAFALSDLTRKGTEDRAPIEVPPEPPRGAWFEKNFDGWEVGATTRSPIAFFLVPFMCVWSGGSLGGIYGSQMASGQFNLVMSLFGIPFILGTLLFGSIALMAVCGKVVVRVRGEQGEVFVGVWCLGWRRRFDPAGIHRVYENERPGRRGNSTEIVMEGDERITLASGLNDNRRYFMLQVLRSILEGHEKEAT
jgi:hypothetical protein